MLERVPWFTGGGAEHSPEIARVLAYAATAGARGVVEVTDLKVSALDVPGASVRIAPGVAVMPNWYPGGLGQSYVGRNHTETLLAIPATDSSGPRSWLVLQRINDPQYPGTPLPADPTDFDYQAFVLVACSSAATDLDVGARLYPSTPLARIDLPPSTATVMPAHITDLRKLINPRRQSWVDITGPSGDDGVIVDRDLGWLGPTGAYDTISRSHLVNVPEWATKAAVRITASGLQNRIGDTYGNLRAQLADIVTGPVTVYDENWAQQAAFNVQRSSYTAAATFDIPPSMRGTGQYVFMRACKLDGSGTLASMVSGTTFVYDIDFSSAPI